MSNQKEETRDYINGKLDGLNILMIYAKDGKAPRIEDVQSEIDSVMHTPVKENEKPASQQAIINIELKQANESLIQFNNNVTVAKKLTQELKDLMVQLPIFPQPEVQMSIQHD